MNRLLDKYKVLEEMLGGDGEHASEQVVFMKKMPKYVVLERCAGIILALEAYQKQYGLHYDGSLLDGEQVLESDMVEKNEFGEDGGVSEARWNIRLEDKKEKLVNELEQEVATECIMDDFYERSHVMDKVAMEVYLYVYEILQREERLYGFLKDNVFDPFLHTVKELSFKEMLNRTDEYLNGQTGKTIVELHTLCHLDILGNVVWKNIVDCVLQCSDIKVSEDNLTAFHENYGTFQRFKNDVLRRLDAKLLHHASTLELEQRFDLNKYVACTSNAFMCKLESAISNNKILLEDREFKYESSVVVHELMHLCISDKIAFKTVLYEFVNLQQDLLLQYLKEFESSNGTIADQVYILHDVRKLKLATTSTVMSQCLQDWFRMFTIDANPNKLFENVHCEMDSVLSAHLSSTSEFIHRECLQALPVVRTIKNQYQMTNKAAPTTSSSFVPNLIAPIVEAITTYDSIISQDHQHEIISTTGQLFFTSYAEMGTDLLRAAKDLEDSLRQRKARQGTATAASTDTRKMALQFQLDMKEIYSILIGNTESVLKIPAMDSFTTILKEFE